MLSCRVAVRGRLPRYLADRDDRINIARDVLLFLEGRLTGLAKPVSNTLLAADLVPREACS